MATPLCSPIATGPAVSVVIPTLNEARTLPRLLASLACVRARSLDVIVVDARSEDDTTCVVERFRSTAPAHVRVRCLSSEWRNVSHQRNLGGRAAIHDLVLFLDADTLIDPPERFAELVDAFVDGRLAAATCRFRPIERDLRAEFYFSLLHGFQRVMQGLDPYAMGACILTTRSVLRRTGGFDPRLRVNEDANFCGKAAAIGRFRVLPVTLRVSARRFRHVGYLRMGVRYVGIFIDRCLHGEAWDDRIAYPCDARD